MPFPGLSANFNEPSTNDQTSAPQMPDQQPMQQQQPTVGQSLAEALKKRKKAGIGPTVKQPSELKAAIARAKRARPSTYKEG
jgi:hypothetical protein